MEPGARTPCGPTIAIIRYLHLLKAVIGYSCTLMGACPDIHVVHSLGHCYKPISTDMIIHFLQKISGVSNPLCTVTVRYILYHIV